MTHCLIYNMLAHRARDTTEYTLKMHYMPALSEVGSTSNMQPSSQFTNITFLITITWGVYTHSRADTAGLKDHYLLSVT